MFQALRRGPLGRLWDHSGPQPRTFGSRTESAGPGLWWCLALCLNLCSSLAQLPWSTYQDLLLAVVSSSEE